MRDVTNQSQPELSLSEPIAIVLALGQWNTVLSLIAKAPWDVADPLMRATRQQIATVLAPRMGEKE